MLDIKTYPRSTYIKGIEWLGERIGHPDNEIMGDTYPLTWGADDIIYTSSGDPLWGDNLSGFDAERLIGSPTDYKIEKTAHLTDYFGWGGDGPKPSGMISVDGVLYLAFQNLLRCQTPPFGIKSQHGSDSYIIYSTNQGVVWTPTKQNIKEPMFPGHKFGGPAFVNFGKDNAGARDSYVYAVSGDQWDNGSNLRLGRVPKDAITDTAAWEFVCAFEIDGSPVWKRDMEQAIPIMSLHKHLGLPEMVYMKKLGRYILFTWRLRGDFSPDDGTDLMIFEAPEPWGPFSLVYTEEYWMGKEFTPYCPRLPLKWVEDDGVTAWMQFSGNWGKVGKDNFYYRSNVRKFKFLV